MDFKAENVVTSVSPNLEKWLGWKGYFSDYYIEMRRYVENDESRHMDNLGKIVRKNNCAFRREDSGFVFQLFYPVFPPQTEYGFDSFFHLSDFLVWYCKRSGLEFSKEEPPVVWVKNKKTGIYALMDGLDFDENHLPVRVLGDWITLERLSERFTLLDGTPIGKRS